MNKTLLECPGQLALWESDRSQRADWPEPILILGIDTSRLPVRVAATMLEAERVGATPYPTEQMSFQTLGEFQNYWNNYVLGSELEVRVAVARNDDDPLGVRLWLEVQNQRLERHAWMASRSHLVEDRELRDLDIPAAYHRPYVLALYSAYRLRASLVARELWAKTFEALDLLGDIRHDLHRLAAALPDADGFWYSDQEQMEVPF